MPGRERGELVARSVDEGGLSDAVLWDLMVTPGADILQGWAFDRAVREDPRRAEALIHARLQAVFARVQGVDPAMLSQTPARDTFFLRNRTLRQTYGRITAAGLASVMALNWRDYSVMFRLLVVQAAQGLPAGIAFLNALQRHLPEIEEAFAESEQITRSAARVAVGDEADAWRDMGGSLLDMRDFIRSAALAVGRPGAPRGGVLPAALPRVLPGAVVEDFAMSAFDRDDVVAMFPDGDTIERRISSKPGTPIRFVYRRADRWVFAVASYSGSRSTLSAEAIESPAALPDLVKARLRWWNDVVLRANVTAFSPAKQALAGPAMRAIDGKLVPEGIRVSTLKLPDAEFDVATLGSTR